MSHLNFWQVIQTRTVVKQRGYRAHATDTQALTGSPRLFGVKTLHLSAGVVSVDNAAKYINVIPFLHPVDQQTRHDEESGSEFLWRQPLSLSPLTRLG